MKRESVKHPPHKPALTEAVAAPIAVGQAHTRFVRLGDLETVNLVHVGGAAPEEARSWLGSKVSTPSAELYW